MIDSLIVGTALAQGGGAPAQPSTLEMFGMPLVFLVVMYFFIIRPQQKKHKAHQELMKTLKSGDEVVTTGGIIGRVRSVSDAFVTLEAGANTQLKVQKAHVTAMMTKPQPAKK